MIISNELLAAYAEGKVSTEERDAVRQYLADNPQELESVMMMMDEDYELEIDETGENAVFLEGNQGCNSFHDIAYSAAAFAPSSTMQHFSHNNHNSGSDDFNSHLECLMDEIGM